MSLIDPRQLVPILNPKITKQHRRSLLSPSQVQLVRQIDGRSNLGMLCSVLGRPLKSMLKHIKKMAFLDAILLCLPPQNQEHTPHPLDTNEWMLILNAPLIEIESPCTRPSFQLPKSSTSIVDLRSYEPYQAPPVARSAQKPGEESSTNEDLPSIGVQRSIAQRLTPAPASKQAASIVMQSAIPTPPPAKASRNPVVDLTSDMQLNATELELPMESDPHEKDGFFVAQTPNKFASLQQIKMMQWTDEHQHLQGKSPAQQPTQEEQPEISQEAPVQTMRAVTPTEEELQLLLAEIAERKRKGTDTQGLYHYSSRSQMDLAQVDSKHPDAPSSASSGHHAVPTAPSTSMHSRHSQRGQTPPPASHKPSSHKK